VGRERKSRTDLPERVYHRNGAYYFVHKATGKWERLDSDYAKAMQKWATLVVAATRTETMGNLFDRYLLEVVPGKAERTQRDNRQELRFLRAFFGNMLIETVTPVNVAAYRDNREAKVRGNREIALLSHVFNYAIRWGLRTDNPCAVPGLRTRERPRTRYVTSEELEAFKTLCPAWLKGYLDLKTLIGARQQDMLALRWGDIDSDGILITPLKTAGSTGKRIKVGITEELRAVLDRIPRKQDLLFPTRTGEQYTPMGFGAVWRKIMAKFVEAGGERFTEHDLRGMVATDMDDAASAQKLLGHKSITMTEAYIKARKTDVVAPLSRNPQSKAKK